MGLQLMASLGGAAFTADVGSAFGQSLKGQRRDAGGKRLFASPPKDFPEKTLMSLSSSRSLPEIYGLVSGPPGWRQTLLGEFKNLDFRRHPLAPCVVLMYEKMHGQQFDLCGVIIIETDDLLGAGIGQKFKDAIERLRERFKFGSWHWLQ